MSSSLRPAPAVAALQYVRALEVVGPAAAAVVRHPRSGRVLFGPVPQPVALAWIEGASAALALQESL